MKQTKTRQTKSNSMIIHVGAGSDAYGKKILQDPDRIIRQDFLIGLQEWIFLCKIVVADFIQDSFVCVWACGCGRVGVGVSKVVKKSNLQLERLVPDRIEGPGLHRGVDQPLAVTRYPNRAVRIAQSCNTHLKKNSI